MRNRQEKECTRVRFHVTFQERMDLQSMEEAVRLLNESVTAFYQSDAFSEKPTEVRSPLVLSVGNGSLLTDVLLPVATIAVPILYDIAKRIFSAHRQYQVQVTVFPDKIRWTDEDNYKISYAVLKEYAVRKSRKSVKAFIKTLHLSLPYSDDSLEVKVGNTRCLMDKYGINHTLNCGSPSNYSKPHEKAFRAACVQLNLP